MRLLNVHPGGTYLDGTLGGATHTEELLKRSAPGGRVLSFDVDTHALQRASERLRAYGSRWIGVEANFRALDRVAEQQGYVPVDGILLDLGFSSDQLVDVSKGLSFQQNGPLDMRLGVHANEDGLTAADIVNTWSAQDLERIIRDYGEERYAWKIAQAIIVERKLKTFATTHDLANFLRLALPTGYERGRLHPATRTFQALRIAVNDELNTLQTAIRAASQVLAPGGRLAIISFHSLEDRIVKRAFLDQEGWTPLTKRPIIASDEECRINPRARSAKLRVASWN